MSGSTLKVALAASLALNIFVLGAVAGAYGTRMRAEQQRVAPGGNPLMRAGDQLPEGQREAFRQRLRQQGQLTQPLSREAREARLEAARALGASDFDAAAVSAAFVRARVADIQAREKLETAVVEFAAGLAPAERRRLAEGLRQPPRAGRGGPGGRGGVGGPGGGRRGPAGMGPGFGPPGGFEDGPRPDGPGPQGPPPEVR